MRKGREKKAFNSLFDQLLSLLQSGLFQDGLNDHRRYIPGMIGDFYRRAGKSRCGSGPQAKTQGTQDF